MSNYRGTQYFTEEDTLRAINAYFKQFEDKINSHQHRIEVAIRLNSPPTGIQNQLTNQQLRLIHSVEEAKRLGLVKEAEWRYID